MLARSLFSACYPLACKQIGSNDVAICQKTRGTILWYAPGMRSVSDLRLLHRYTHTHTHAHRYTHLADLHTYAGVRCGTGDRRWDCVISRGGGTGSRNEIRSWSCSFRCFCTRKGLRVVAGMRDARRRCDFAMADLYRVMLLSHGCRADVHVRDVAT